MRNTKLLAVLLSVLLVVIFGGENKTVTDTASAFVVILIAVPMIKVLYQNIKLKSN